MQNMKTILTSQAAPAKLGMGMSANKYPQAWNLLCDKKNRRPSVIVSDHP